MMKRVIGALFLLTTAAAAGCGGGGGAPPPPPVTTYTLIGNEAQNVPYATCVALDQPFTVPAASFNFDITDTLGDNLEVGIISDSIFSTSGCVWGSALIDVSFTGSYSSSQSPVYSGDAYDFIVACRNASLDCQFRANWTATY
jgi:hypothetical protein